jgi:hypothetical protein
MSNSKGPVNSIPANRSELVKSCVVPQIFPALYTIQTTVIARHCCCSLATVSYTLSVHLLGIFWQFHHKASVYIGLGQGVVRGVFT